MFRIGEFSKFSRVSVKMLRHYDRLGLLRPAHIDPETAYRYYSANQLPRLNRILALRDLGFSLDQIAALVDADTSAEAIRSMLRLKQAELERLLADEQRRLDRIAARLTQIEEEGRVEAVDILVRQVEAQPAAMVRQALDDIDEIQLLFEEVERYVAQFGARAEKPPLAIYHDADYRESQVDVEVVIPIDFLIPGSTRVAVGVTPAWESMACLVHTGRYDTIDQTTGALLTWIEANSYTIAGPSREVYLRFGASDEAVSLPTAYLTDNPDEYVTEVQIPIVRRP